MAIYHMSAQVIGRSSGRSSVAAAAYRSGERLIDERTGEIHDYTKKQGVDFKEILTPENCGEWAKDRGQLWNMTEQTEKRKDAQLAREINIAIPVELSREQGRELVTSYAQESFVSQGMVADICIHGEGTSNPHAHIMLSMREAGEDALGKKVREWNDKEQLEKWREGWAHQCNKSLENAGVNVIVDHRSYEAQGLEQVPTIHRGPAATEIEREGRHSNLENINRDIAELNAVNKSIEAAKKDIEEINKALSEIQISTPEDKSAKTADTSIEQGSIEEARKTKQRDDEDKKLKEAACYGVSARDAYERLCREKDKLHSASVKVHWTNEEIKEHNKKVDNMGFFDKALNAGTVNKAGEELDKKLETLTADYERKSEDVNKLEAAHEILNRREREERERYAASPEGRQKQEEREQQFREKQAFIEQMRMKRDKERGPRGR